MNLPAIFPLLLAIPLAAQEPIRGFTPAGVKHQIELESKAIATLDAARIGRHIKAMSAKPHAAGSPASKEVANCSATSDSDPSGIQSDSESRHWLFHLTSSHRFPVSTWHSLQS